MNIKYLYYYSNNKALQEAFTVYVLQIIGFESE